MQIDSEQAIERVMKLMAIPGKSCQEGLISEAVVGELRAAGVPADDILLDDAHTRTNLPGEVGNLIVRIPGTKPGPTVLLSAHLDTVPICVGCQPVREGEHVRSADPSTGLGADNRAGVAAILTAALELLKSDRPYSPLVLCFFVQEEIGLQGSRNLDPQVLGPIDLALNFDGGTVDKLVVGATGGERMRINISGKASHAGIAPEEGVNAGTIASLAIASLYRDGWLGRVERGGGMGTSNVGVISGGEATNVVLPELLVRAEARSHDSDMRTRIVEAFRAAFATAAEEVKSPQGVVGSVQFSSQLDYDSFRLPDDSASVLAAKAAVTQLGREPVSAMAGGGVDANWLYRHGIHAVTLGCGQRDVHTTAERLNLQDYLDACRIAMSVAENEF
ncbi:M20/M25/M40 family metallo-hydrolase [Planctomycetaceae bacterium SH139]